MTSDAPRDGWTVWMMSVRGVHFDHRNPFSTPEQAQAHANMFIRVRPAWLKEIRVYSPDHDGEDDYHSREVFDG